MISNKNGKKLCITAKEVRERAAKRKEFKSIIEEHLPKINAIIQEKLDDPDDDENTVIYIFDDPASEIIKIVSERLKAQPYEYMVIPISFYPESDSDSDSDDVNIINAIQISW